MFKIWFCHLQNSIEDWSGCTWFCCRPNYILLLEIVLLNFVYCKFPIIFVLTNLLTNVWCLGFHCNGIHTVCSRECWHCSYWGNSFSSTWCLLSAILPVLFHSLLLLFLMCSVGRLLTFLLLLLVNLILFVFYGFKVILNAFHYLIQNFKMEILILILFILCMTGWVGGCTGCNKYYF